MATDIKIDDILKTEVDQTTLSSMVATLDSSLSGETGKDDLDPVSDHNDVAIDANRSKSELLETTAESVSVQNNSPSDSKINILGINSATSSISSAVNHQTTTCGISPTVVGSTNVGTIPQLNSVSSTSQSFQPAGTNATPFGSNGTTRLPLSHSGVSNATAVGFPANNNKVVLNVVNARENQTRPQFVIKNDTNLTPAPINNIVQMKPAPNALTQARPHGNQVTQIRPAGSIANVMTVNKSGSPPVTVVRAPGSSQPIQIVNVNSSSVAAAAASPLAVASSVSPSPQQQGIVNQGHKVLAPRVIPGAVRIQTPSQPQATSQPRPLTNIQLTGAKFVMNEQNQLVMVQQNNQQQLLQQQQTQPQPRTLVQAATRQPGAPAVTNIVRPVVQPQPPQQQIPTRGQATIVPNHVQPGPFPARPQQPIVQAQVASQQAPRMVAQTVRHVQQRPAVLTESVMENVKKCKNFLSTLLKLASSQPQSTVTNVRNLIQSLVDGTIEPEAFTEQLQVELRSNPQPFLVPFLKKSLPNLRQAMQQGLMQISGIRPPGGSRTPTLNRFQQTRNLQAGVLASKPPLGGVMLPQPGGAVERGTEKRKYDSISGGGGDDDINDVATMGGVNLTEETRNMASSLELLGGQMRSCKDEAFLIGPALSARINAMARRRGLSDCPAEVCHLLSHACQEWLRELAERLSVVAEHRLEMYKTDDRYESTTDVRSQLRFLEDLEKVEQKRHDDEERDKLFRVAKSRSKHEDPEHTKLKEKAKALQAQEAEEVRQREANRTALAAIGSKKKKRLDEGGFNAVVSNRPRVKRVTLRDLVFLLEQDKRTQKSATLYRTLLK